MHHKQGSQLLPSFWLLVVIVLAGCGKPTSSPISLAAPPTATPQAERTPGASTLSTPLPVGSPPTSTPSLATSPSISTSSSSVTLFVDASAARSSRLILVTVDNEGTSSIQFPDHLSNCSTVLLERQVGTSWQPVSICHLMTPTRMVTLAPGQRLTIHLVDALESPQWQPGRYQISLTYQSSQQSRTLVSPIFQLL